MSILSDKAQSSHRFRKLMVWSLNEDQPAISAECLLCPSMYIIISNDSKSGQRRPRSACARRLIRTFAFRRCPESIFARRGSNANDIKSVIIVSHAVKWCQLQLIHMSWSRVRLSVACIKIRISVKSERDMIMSMEYLYYAHYDRGKRMRKTCLRGVCRLQRSTSACACAQHHWLL